MQQKKNDKVEINGNQLTLKSDGSEWRKYNAVDFYGTFDLILGSPARGRLEDYKKEKENEVKQDKNENSTEEKEMLSQETIDSYAVLHRGFSNYLIAEQSSITVLDPNVLSLQNGRFVASTDIGTPLQP